MARELRRRSGIPDVELDALILGPGWERIPAQEFRARVRDIIAQETWIIHGNYASVRDLAWQAADVVVWLDLSLPVVVRRLVLRTVTRLRTRENVAGDNKERIGRLLGPRSIFRWAVQSHRPLRAEYERAQSVYGDRTVVVRLRSPHEQRRWLEACCPAREGAADAEPRGLECPTR